jgi:hypothetical protein
MYCPFCGKDIADEAVVCLGCGRPVTPLKQVSNPGSNLLSGGAKAVHDTAVAFLVCGIINIVAGIIVTSIGWFFGIFSVIVGIIELVNSNKYWPTPPKSNSNPIFITSLEMLAAFSGSFWSFIIGLGNRNRLNSPAVKQYFLELQSGQPLDPTNLQYTSTSAAAPSGSISSESFAFTMRKKCPSCANLIPLEAKICQFCKQAFSDEEIQSAKMQYNAEVAQKAAEDQQKRKLGTANNQKVFGVISAVLGVLGAAFFLLVMFAPTTAADSRSAFLYLILFCPVPMVVLGGVLFYLGRRSQAKLEVKPASF